MSVLNYFENEIKNSVLKIEKNLLKQNIENVKHIDLSNKRLNSFPEFIKDLIHLESLVLSNNQIEIIPEWISNLKNLTILNLSNNQINALPQNISQCTNLKTLNVSTNKISIIPDELFELHNIEFLNFNCNNINDIPNDIIRLTNIKELWFSGNNIMTMPNNISLLTTLKNLNFSHNHLNNITISFAQLINLKNLWLNNNNITQLGNLNLNNNCKLFIEENPIEIIQQNVRAHLKKQVIIKNIYNDSQSVHNHQLQEGIGESIISLLNDKCGDCDYLAKILDSPLELKTKNIIYRYYEENFCYYDYDNNKNISFKTLLKYVWNRIDKHENKNDLIKIFDDEIIESEKYCNTGKISRLINVLNGFYDDIKIHISENERIGAIIVNLRKKYYSNNEEELRNIIKKELVARNFSEEIINVWIEHVTL
jgi:Leucine-rich repeat (LRR) protein